MSLTLLKDPENEQTIQHRARATIEAQTTKFVELNAAEPVPIRKGQHLDVDGILARSLPKTVDR